jgi:hypothetical protein
MMRWEKITGTKERRIVTGMIVSPVVLSRIVPKWEDKGLFEAPWANLVGGWCVEYHKHYNKAPGKNIAASFEAWAEDNEDKASVQLVEKFLSSISGEYASLKKEVNADHIIDMAGVHFNKVKLQRHKDALEGYLEDGKVDKALALYDKFQKVNLASSGRVDVLRDSAAMQKAFEDKKDPLIVYPGGLGEFFGDALERDGFVAFTGPEKRGKTWWLIDIAWTAMKQRRKVAFFEVGDLSQSQIMRRFGVRASRRPLKAKTLRVPKAISFTPEAGLQVEHDEKTWDRPLSWQEASKASLKTLEKARSKEGLLMLETYPNSSISVQGIDGIIRQYDREGWSPDVIVIDYADILAPVNGSADTRDQINTTWKLLRRMSQEWHCLVVTATQTNAKAYNVKTLSKSEFSEDKRKHAHVTAMAGINQTDDEKKTGVQRLNWVDLREEEYIESQCVYVAGCLGIAQPAMKSVFPRGTW